MRTLAAIFLLLLGSSLDCQEPRPLDSKTVTTEYSFTVRNGRPPLTVRVEIGPSGKIGDALVFQQGDPKPFQRLASCQPDLAMELQHGEENTVLIEQADFNFDGFVDLKLLQFHHPHLGKSIFCVYLWEEKTSKFRYDPQIPMPDPTPHPGNRTITTHDEYMGGTWSDSVYVWSGGKIIPIAKWGLANEAGMTGRKNANCPWTAWCAKRINGRMRNVSRTATGCNDTDPAPVKCTPPPRSVYAAPMHPK